MAAMPRPRKPYVQRETSRHGKITWYFRRGNGPRIRLHGEYGSAEWNADYESALAGVKPIEPVRSQAGTLRWLVTRYYDSLAFTSEIKPATQKQRRSLLNSMLKTGGDLNYRLITSADIVAGMDRRSKHPAQAVSYVKANRGLFKWAKLAGHVDHDPTEGVTVADPKTEGHHTWTMEEVAKFCERHPVGTMARLAMDIMLFTGMRISDAILFGRQHIRGNVIQYRSVKTGVEVVVPLLEPLRQSIEATKTGDMHFLVTEFGKPFASVNGAGNWFRKRCREAGVPGRAHGLRKAGAAIAAENGATDRELMAMWGWTTERQAGVYTRKADKARLARQAAEKLERGTSIPAPGIPVRDSERKAQ